MLITMEISGITLFYIFMTIGIGFGLFLIHDAKKSSKLQHERNARERQRLEKLYGGVEHHALP